MYKLQIKYIFIWLLILGQRSFSQSVIDHFYLKGKIEGKDTGIIYLGYYDAFREAIKNDSAIISNGKFYFSGKVKGPTVAFIRLRNKEAFGLNATNIFLEPAKLFVNLSVDNFDEAHLTGSESQMDYEEIRSKGNKIRKNHPELFANKSSLDYSDSLKNLLNIIYDSLAKIEYEYFSTHPTAYLTAYLLQYHRKTLSVDSLALFYNRLSEDLKQHPVTQNIKEKIKNKELGSVGSVAAKFIAKDTSGIDFYSGFIKGKYILLDFWASWCVPCRQNSPHIIELFKKYNHKGLQIIGIADDRDVKKWKEAIREDRTNLWPQVLRGANPELKMKGFKDENDVNDKFGVSVLPTYILIDPFGIIIGRYDEDLRELDERLKSIFQL